MKKSISPALVLWFLAPVFGEMVSGSTPLNEYWYPWVILIFGMLYGSGAVLIREIVVRWKKGWVSLLLLGMAYGIYEEGLMVRSFFDPGWMDLDNLGVYGRVAGVNWVWAEHLTIFHALISIAASIVFVQILYPEKRAEPWIGARGLTWNALAFAASLPLGGLLNPYDAPDAWLGMGWLAIAALTLSAWRVRAPETARIVKVSRPRYFWWIGFLGTFFQFFFIYITAEKGSPPFVLTIILVALYDLFLLWLVRRGNGDFQAWDDRHRIALINGTLSLFLILIPLVTNGQYPVMYVTNPILLFCLWWVARRVKQRVNAEHAAQPTIEGFPTNQAA